MSAVLQVRLPGLRSSSRLLGWLLTALAPAAAQNDKDASIERAFECADLTVRARYADPEVAELDPRVRESTPTPPSSASSREMPGARTWPSSR